MLRKMLLFVLAVSATAFSQTVKFGVDISAHPTIPTLLTRCGPGPSGFGWTGLQPHLGPDWLYEDSDMTDIQKAGYTFLIGVIQRDSIRFNRWSYVQSAIDSGKKWGIKYYYIDDCYSEAGKILSVGQVDMVGHYVHSADSSFKLVVAEYSLSKVDSALGVGGYDSVDCVLPYNYRDSTISFYSSFMQQMRAALPSRIKFIPQLGYHEDDGDTLIPPAVIFPNQIGAFIDTAKHYADLGIIYYYTWWNGTDSAYVLNYLYKLTNYLQMNYGMSGTPAPVGVILDQKTQEGNRVGSVGLWNTSSFVSHSPGDTVFLTRTSNQTVCGDQNIYSGEKYNNWVRNGVAEPDVPNHHVFTNITVNDSNFTANLVHTYSGVTIQNNLIDAPTATTNVNFQDPWFIDSTDQSYGGAKRNEGMSAPFISRASPFHPDLTTSYGGNKYLGVFLNQNQTFNPSLPIYSVSFPSQSISVGGTNHPLYFMGWSPSGATLKDATKDTTAVVFTSSNATVTANVKGIFCLIYPLPPDMGTSRK